MIHLVLARTSIFTMASGEAAENVKSMSLGKISVFLSAVTVEPVSGSVSVTRCDRQHVQ